jgi:CxxC-x17-CxxC domain-containing protein
MNNFNNRDSRGGGNFRSGGRDRGRADHQMFDAVCDECGKNCQVPFQPTSGKPIYCSECFEKRGGNERRDDRGGRSSFGGGRRDDRGGRPSFGGGRRDDRNARPSFGGDRAPRKDNSSEKIEALSSRLDKVFELLQEIKSNQVNSNVVTEEAPKETTKKKVAVKKAPAKKAVKKVAKK